MSSPAPYAGRYQQGWRNFIYRETYQNRYLVLLGGRITCLSRSLVNLTTATKKRLDWWVVLEGSLVPSAYIYQEMIR